MLLVFEDLHWIDAETQALLDRLVEACRRRASFCCELSPGYAHTWGNKSYYTSFGSTRWGRQAPRSCWCAARGRASVEPLKTLLVTGPRATRSSWRRASARWSRPARWSGARALPLWQRRDPRAGDRPGVLAARIDRLPPEEKRLLQTAAVIGKDVPCACSRRSPTPTWGHRTALVRLQGPSGVPAEPLPGLEYRSSTPSPTRWRTAAAPERRRELHARIVEAIESALRRPPGRARRAAGRPRVGREVWEKAAATGHPQAQGETESGRRTARRSTLQGRRSRPSRAFRRVAPGSRRPSTSASFSGHPLWQLGDFDEVLAIASRGSSGSLADCGMLAA